MFEINNRRYTGSKAKLSTWILDKISKNCSGEIFADIFAGTGIVGSEASFKYPKIILNDLLFSNEIIYKAFFINANVDEKKLNIFVEKFNSIDPQKISDNYFSLNFGGKYFEYDDAKKIGKIREIIEIEKSNLSEKEYAVLISSLLYSVDKIANTVGHYDAYFKKNKMRSLFVYKLINYTPRNSEFFIHRRDANELAANIYADIVYIDPPYNSRQYSRFYHLLETLTKWDKPELYGVALKPTPENMSEYCRATAKEQFIDLIKRINCRYIVVSYNNTYNSKSKSSKNKITLDDIKNELSKIGKTKVSHMSHRCFNAGKTNFDDHKEFLFITEVGAFDE
jgi:adenine-specific DNA-methyltransferase